MFRYIVICVASLVMGASTLAAEPDTVPTENLPPLTLRQAIDAALGGNPALRTFEFEFRAEDARIRQASLAPAPEASLEVEDVLGTGAANGVDSAQYTLALSQVLELGGKRDARVAVAQSNRDALAVSRRVTQLDVLADVTRRFIAVAARQEHVRLTLRAVALAEQTADGSERRVNAAKAPHAELDRARIALDRARLDQKRAGLQLEAARKQLAATWGESQPVIGDRRFGEVAADLFVAPQTGDFEELVERLAANPDFLLFASEARLRDAELRLASSRRSPDIAVSGGVRRMEEGNDESFVASISVPLFSGRRAESFVAEATANRDLVAAERRIAQTKAEALLYELHRELRGAVLEVESLRGGILPRAEEAMNETEYAYERGRYSYLELVDAQREFLALQAAMIDAAANAQTLRAEIERLTNTPLTDPNT